jgi:hypothetical protein
VGGLTQATGHGNRSCLDLSVLPCSFFAALGTSGLLFPGQLAAKQTAYYWLLDLQLDETHPDTSTQQSAIEPLSLRVEQTQLVFSLPFKSYRTEVLPLTRVTALLAQEAASRVTSRFCPSVPSSKRTFLSKHRVSRTQC